MIVALDAQLTVGTATGIGEYVRGLEPALRAQDVQVVALREPRLDPWRFDRRVAWDQIVLPLRASRSGAQLLHCASGTMPLWPLLPVVVTVHDVAWLKAQHHARWYARRYFGPLMLARYKRARAIAVDSNFSRSELLSALDYPSDNVHAVYPGVAAEFCELQRAPQSEAFVLVPGTVERRKNLEVLIRALPRLDSRLRIVCAGPFTPYRQECEELAQSLGVSDRIEFRGYVPRDELLELYARCALVAVPSTYEGFGYAAAQALCASVPVLVSDRSSLPEIVGGDAAVIPAGDPAAWAIAIESIVRDATSAQVRSDAVRSRSIDRFSWQRAATETKRVYDIALNQEE